MFSLCSHDHMVKARTRSATPSAAPLAADDHDIEVLSGLMDMGYELAQGFRAAGVKAQKAGDFDKARVAETHFSSLALGIRRAIALKARLRQWREEAQRRAEGRHERRQAEKTDRRRQVAEGVARAIA